MELLEILTSQLGISEEQAKGGSGLIMKLVKDKLSGDEFSKVAEAIPGVQGLIAAAPESGGLMSALTGLAASLGLGGKLGNLSSLASGFKNLDMDTTTIGKFVPIVLSFAQEKGGDTVKNLLEKVLK
jgi:hypothetical protein